MGIFKRLLIRVRRQWRRKQVAKSKSILREFIYLDEVSVYSLIGSRLGPIATEFTETETKSLQSNVNASLGITGASLGSSISSNQGEGSQVLRKSVIQTTFKELYEFEKKSLIISSLYDETKAPINQSLDKILSDGFTSGGVVNSDKFVRGELFEMEVQLEAESIFKVSAVLSSLLELLKEDSSALGMASKDEILKLKSVDSILSKLLVGLVPIRGYAVDYKVIEYNNMEWVVHRNVLKDLEDNNSYIIRPLYIVGVAEHSLFWKDIRRILFSNLKFKVLCRISQDGIQNSWTPIKLSHVLESLVPDLGKQIDGIGSEAIDTMLQNSQKTAQDNEDRLIFMKKALTQYSKLLAEHYNLQLTEIDKGHISKFSEQYATYFNSLKSRRLAFDKIADYLLTTFGIERDQLVISSYRTVALSDIGLDIFGEPLPLIGKTTQQQQQPDKPDHRFLDTEFIAIYW